MTDKGRRKRHDNGGLIKKCGCARRKWIRCAHPWHIEFMHRRQSFRLSLARYATGTEPMTKTAAQGVADRIRSEVRAGTFVDPRRPATAATPATAAGQRTFSDVADLYVKAPDFMKRSAAARKATAAQLSFLLRHEIPGANGRRVRLGDLVFTEIAAGDIENFKIERQQQAAKLKADAEARAQAAAAAAAAEGETPAAPAKQPRRPALGAKGNAVGTNRLLELWRAVTNWSLPRGYIQTSPFTFNGKPAVGIGPDSTIEKGRDRRLQGDEEARLLAAAEPRLKALIVAALDLGGRRGELLNLTWADVAYAEGPDRKLHPSRVRLVATKTDDKPRWIPVSIRLRGYLEMLRTGPDGKDFGLDRHVFGNEVGEKVDSFKRAWAATVLRASGHTPKYTATGQLDAPSRAAYAAVNLHFHDLRHEAGSSLLESGATLIEVRDYLGHADVSMTNSYLQTTVTALDAALARREQYRESLHKVCTPAGIDAPAATTTVQ